MSTNKKMSVWLLTLLSWETWQSNLMNWLIRLSCGLNKSACPPAQKSPSFSSIQRWRTIMQIICNNFHLVHHINVSGGKILPLNLVHHIKVTALICDDRDKEMTTYTCIYCHNFKVGQRFTTKYFNIILTYHLHIPIESNFIIINFDTI